MTTMMTMTMMMTMMMTDGVTDNAPPVERSVALHEQVEDVRQQLRGDSLAGISHPQDRLMALAGNRQGDPTTGWGILRRIVQQVCQDLLQPVRIAFHSERLRR
jgi:hypothetical protein